MNKPGEFFKNMVICILPCALGKSRLKLLESHVLGNGGKLATLNSLTRNDSTSRIVVAEDSLNEDSINKIVAKSLNSDHSENIVKVSWITECMRQKKLVDFSDFHFSSKITESEAKYKETCIIEKGNNRIKRARLEMLDLSSDSDDCIDDHNVQYVVESTTTNIKPNKIDPMRFACAWPSISSQKINHNQHITEKLEHENMLKVSSKLAIKSTFKGSYDPKSLASTYKMTQDHWRAIGYERAIAALKRHPKEIVTWEEAKSLPAIGDRLADKIMEIVASGSLRKMEEVTSDEKVIAMKLFGNVWGIGPTTAQNLVQRGYRTLEDLTAANCLNRQQKIGLHHYDDLLERMPRDEASEIGTIVRNKSMEIQSDVVAITCGSYRRGKSNCGDVDVLVTHPDGKSHRGLLPRIVSSLKDIGFLTDDLVAHEENGAQHKYMGICRLPGKDTKHRRLDIIVVPYAEFACSLLYFTGSAHFNRSMRLLARKVGMSLSEHSLNSDVIRKGQSRVSEGSPLSTPTEKSIFEHLKLPYRPPEERDL